MEKRPSSGGERQRLHLARVLLQLSHAEDTPSLLRDEPTPAQAVGQRGVVVELLRHLAKSIPGMGLPWHRKRQGRQGQRRLQT